MHVENEPGDLQVADLGLRERCSNNDDYRVENDLAPESIDMGGLIPSLAAFCLY